jgi:taurine dioxygenase
MRRTGDECPPFRATLGRVPAEAVAWDDRGVRTTPLSPAVGVEILDLDLAPLDAGGALDPDDVATLRAAYDEHHLLLVRGQSCGPDAQVAFTGLFGPVLAERSGARHAFVSNTHPDGFVREGPLLFHSDLAFTPEPVLGISLQALDVPPGGAPTRYANAAAAYATLPADVRARLDDLHVVHAYDLWTQANELQARRDVIDPTAPRATHPLVLAHPRTGTPILYVGEMQAERVVELEPDESRALLDDLLAHLYRPEHRYDHAWDVGDLVVWDNLALQHGRGAVTDDGPRTLRRVALAHHTIGQLIPELASRYP